MHRGCGKRSERLTDSHGRETRSAVRSDRAVSSIGIRMAVRAHACGMYLHETHDTKRAIRNTCAHAVMHAHRFARVTLHTRSALTQIVFLCGNHANNSKPWSWVCVWKRERERGRERSRLTRIIEKRNATAVHVSDFSFFFFSSVLYAEVTAHEDFH